jgi:orotate phosphoribosyltransferase-like protein
MNTDQLVARIRQLHAEGVSIDQIARLVNVDRGTVAYCVGRTLWRDRMIDGRIVSMPVRSTIVQIATLR